MKIAISAGGNGWDERYDERFGRAWGFFVYDTKTQETTYIDNRDNVEAAHGAGTSSARAVVDAGVEAVITGRVGPNAEAVLRAAGIRIITRSGCPTVQGAFDSWKQAGTGEQTS